MNANFVGKRRTPVPSSPPLLPSYVPLIPPSALVSPRLPPLSSLMCSTHNLKILLKHGCPNYMRIDVLLPLPNLVPAGPESPVAPTHTRTYAPPPHTHTHTLISS